MCFKPKVNIPKVEPTAAPASTAPIADTKQETGLDTVASTLKRKAQGKKGLMISQGSGLNI